MLCTYNVSAAIPGRGGGPSHLHNAVYKCPLPKTKKATNAPPLGAKNCAMPSQKVQYFKRVL